MFVLVLLLVYLLPLEPRVLCVHSGPYAPLCGGCVCLRCALPHKPGALPSSGPWPSPQRLSVIWPAGPNRQTHCSRGSKRRALWCRGPKPSTSASRWSHVQGACGVCPIKSRSLSVKRIYFERKME